MIYIKNECTNPYYNLALEEYVLRNITEDDVFLLWQNEPTIVVGKFQNVYNEINLDFVKKNNINVVRRISGGGTVYHDFGNINFTFITKNDGKLLLDFKEFTMPIVYTLNKLGVEASLTGRNDITVDGKKISGNAQHINKDRMFNHGTLLFDSHMENLVRALNVDNEKIISKGIKSVRSRVANIRDYLKEDITIDEFKNLLIKYVFEYNNTAYEEYILSEEEKNEIKSLMEKKYMTWDWNYGQSPDFNYKNSARFNGGKLEVCLNISKGIIAECKIYGDFLGLVSLDDFESAFKGLKYDRDEIINKLSSFDLKKYFGTLTIDEILSCFIQ